MVRELVKLKRTYRRAGRPGRPSLDPMVRELILRLAQENPRWGCMRIGGWAAQALDPRRSDRDTKFSRRDLLGGPVHEYHGLAA